MGLFKSKEERRLERDMVARRALANFKRQIVQQDKHEKDYIQKAIRAKQLGDQRMLETLKAQIRRTHLMKYRFERSMLVLETAMQAKEQIESFEVFGQAMGAISKSIEQSFGVTNLVKTQKEYEMAMGKASNMEQRIDLFLESSMDAVEDVSDAEAAAAISDGDLDRMLSADAAKAEDVDSEIEAGLRNIQKELQKGK